MQLVYFKYSSLQDVNYIYIVIKNSKTIMIKRQLSEAEKAMWLGARPTGTLYYSVIVWARARPFETWNSPVKNLSSHQGNQ